MKRLRAIVLLSGALLCGACGMVVRAGETEALLRPAEDTPSRFTTPDGVMPEEGCRTVLVDPRDQTTIRLARSAQYGMSSRGDFEVEDGRYGVRRGELLRVDCTTGEALGIVRH